MDGLKNLRIYQDGVAVNTYVALVSEDKTDPELGPHRPFRAVEDSIGVQCVRYLPLEFPLKVEGEHTADHRRLLGLKRQLPILDLIAMECLKKSAEMFENC